MASPTQMAERSFVRAKSDFENTTGQAYGQGQIPGEMREGLAHLCDGLRQVSVGLRATYALLEDVQQAIAEVKALQLQNRARP
jgi:hypothetical protein